MVYVGVREDYGIDGGAGEGKMAILLVGVLAAALVEATIEQVTLAAVSTRCMDPVTVPAAPQNVSFICRCYGSA